MKGHFVKLLGFGWLLMIPLLFGCNIQYQAVGKYSNLDEFLIGDFDHNLLDGSASFQFKGTRSNLTCSGIGEGPDYIPSKWICEGQKGKGSGSCSDERTLKFEWEADSCTLTHGKGEDSLGNTFYFVTGLNKDEIKDYTNKVKNGMSQEDAKNYINQQQEKEKKEYNKLNW